jgi:large subunit ribosomal protein L18
MTDIRIRRQRSKSKLVNTEFPVLVVSKSNANITAQVRDAKTGKTLFGSTSSTVKKGNKTEKAQAVGQSIADAAKSKKMNRLVVDRNGHVYHGRVKALVESVREHGITI